MLIVVIIIMWYSDMWYSEQKWSKW